MKRILKKVCVMSLIMMMAVVMMNTKASAQENRNLEINKQGYKQASAYKETKLISEPTWANTVDVSNIADLQSEITNATQPTEIKLTQDVVLSGTQLSIPAGKTIKITTTGAQYKLDANQLSRVVVNEGTLYLNNVVITGGRINYQGGGIWNKNNAILVMQSGKITANILTGTAVTAYHEKYASGGGGVYNEGTFTLVDGMITANVASNAGGVHNYGVNSTFTMNGGEISNHTVTSDAGGVENSGGSFVMNDGLITGNTTSYSGGGVDNGIVNNMDTPNTSGTFTMNGGVITNNNAQTGGGVGNFVSSFTMNGGEIHNNTASTYNGVGGGVYALYGTQFTMNNGKIYNNTAHRGAGVGLTSKSGTNLDTSMIMKNGEISNNHASYGGAGIWAFGVFTMEDGKITGNSADLDGGGIHQGSTTSLITIKKGEITNNSAVRDGGGIMITFFNNPTYSMQYQLANIKVETDGVFANNTAGTYYNIYPSDIPLHTTQIQTTSYTTPFHYAYNNYDIAYRSAAVAVTFDGNGGKVANGDSYRSLMPTATLNADMPQNPTREGYRFAGWNTNADGSGTVFDNTTVVNADIIVYAQWAQLYTVTFDSQGGSFVGVQTNLEKGDYVVEPSNPTRSGYTFNGWYTDSSYKTEWKFTTDTVSGNMTLYAKWTKVSIVDPVDPTNPTDPSTPSNPTIPGKPLSPSVTPGNDKTTTMNPSTANPSANTNGSVNTMDTTNAGLLYVLLASAVVVAIYTKRKKTQE